MKASQPTVSLASGVVLNRHAVDTTQVEGLDLVEMCQFAQKVRGDTQVVVVKHPGCLRLKKGMILPSYEGILCVYYTYIDTYEYLYRWWWFLKHFFFNHYLYLGR